MADETLLRPGPALSAISDTPVIEPDPQPPADPPTPPAEPVDPPPVEPTPEPAPEPPADPAAEPVESVEPAPEPTVEAKPRVDPRTARIRQQEQETETLRADLRVALQAIDRLTQAQKPPEPPATPKPVETAPQPAPRPVREAFDDPQAYDEALIEWSAQRALNVSQAESARRAAEAKAAEDKAAQEKAANDQRSQIEKDWQNRRTAFIEAHPDYQEVAEASTVPINQAVGQLIVMDAKGPDIAYYLGQNPTEATRLAQITNGVELVMEFGALKAKLATEATPERPQISRVPRPIVPVGNRSTAAAVDPETQSGDEYFNANIDKYRNERAKIGRVN